MKLIKKFLKYLMWSLWITAIAVAGYRIFTETGSGVLGFYVAGLMYALVAIYFLLQKQSDAQLELLSLTTVIVIEIIEYLNKQQDKQNEQSK